MSQFYQRMQNTAARLIEKFDQGGVELLAKANDPLDPWAEEDWWSTPINATVKTVNINHLKDTRVQATDLAVTCDGSHNITMKNKISIAGREFTIIALNPKPATGIVAAWEVIVRS